jgi:hypothetical protein
MYKKGMTKEKFAGKMRFFWTKHWYYQNIDFWVKISMEKLSIDARDSSSWRNSVFDAETNAAYNILDSAIDKLVLEKLLSKAESKRIRELFKSPDEENHVVALSIMASRKPKKFKDGQKASE